MPADVALVVDGGRRDGPPPTVVDATVSPIRVLREGALPASFIEGTMLMRHAPAPVLAAEAHAVGLSTAGPLGPVPGLERGRRPPTARPAGSELTDRRASQWLRRPRAAKCAGRSVSAWVASHSRLRCRL